MDLSKANQYFIDEIYEKRLWGQAVFVFDSSALLAFYDYSDSGREELFNKILDNLEGRLWVPSHVEFEYLKNRKSKIRNPIDEKIIPVERDHIVPIKQKIKGILNHYKNILDATKPNNFPPSFNDININDFQNKISSFEGEINVIMDKISFYLKEETEKVESYLDQDVIFQALKSRFSVGEEFGYDQILKLIESEGELRFRNKIPPGYMDDPKYNSKSNKRGTQIFGDLIIWKQVLEFARAKKCSVVFVTNDLKEDWCYVDKGVKSRVERPREELIQEFRSTVGKDFWLYSISDLLYYSEKFFNTIISDNLIEEVDENINVDSHLTYFKKEKIIGDWINEKTNISIDALDEQPDLNDLGYDFYGKNERTGVKVLVEVKFLANSLIRVSPSMFDFRPRKYSKYVDRYERIDYIVAIGFNNILDASRAGRALLEMSEQQRQNYKPINLVANFFVVGYFKNGQFFPLYSNYSEINDVI